MEKRRTRKRRNEYEKGKERKKILDGRGKKRWQDLREKYGRK